MIVNRTLADRLLSIVELKTKQSVKPLRVCSDCLEDAQKYDPELWVGSLTKHDREVLKWKCQNKGCYSRVSHHLVDADAFERAKKKNPVRESNPKAAAVPKKDFIVNYNRKTIKESVEYMCEHCGSGDLTESISFLCCNRCGRPTRAVTKG